jgi:protein-S-isoprenylcysteine O-methyltransferase Ste14
MDDRLLYDSDGHLRARKRPPLPGKVAVAGAASIVLGVLVLLGFWWTIPTLAPIGGILFTLGCTLIFSWAVRRPS